MSDRPLIEDALRRRRAFEGLSVNLETIERTVELIDADAEIYLFGSVAEGTYTLSSDIDVLIVTEAEPARVHLALWKQGVREPFQIHVQPPGKLAAYKERARLVPVNYLGGKSRTS